MIATAIDAFCMNAPEPPTDPLARLRIERQPLRMESSPGDSLRRRLTRIALATALTGGAAWLYASGLLQPSLPVRTITVQRLHPAQQLAVLNATGYVVPQTRSDVASKATGRLEWLGVAEGSRVRAGQIIARLESADVEAEQARARANLAVARAQLTEAEVERSDAERNLVRVRDLAARNFLSSQDLDTATARHDRAKARLQNARGAVAVAAAALQSADVAVEYTRIRAPFDGVVVAKNANVGDIVAPFSSAVQSKAAVVSIVDMETLEVEADVSESNIGQVQTGQPCDILLDALPDTRLRGVVNRIVPTVDRAKATVLVKVAFTDHDPRVLPEMSAKVAFLSRELAADERQAVTAVPAGALTKADGLTRVWRIEGGTAHSVAVETGRRFGDRVEIIEGLRPGIEILAEPPAGLQEGRKLRAEGS